MNRNALQIKSKTYTFCPTQQGNAVPAKMRGSPRRAGRFPLLSLLFLLMGCSWFSVPPAGGENSEVPSNSGARPTLASATEPADGQVVPKVQITGEGQSAASERAKATAIAGTAIAIVAELKQVSSDKQNQPVAVATSDSQPESITPRTRVGDLLSGAAKTTSSQGEEQKSEWQGQVTADFVNIRSGPATTYSIIGQARSGDFLTVTGRSESGDWWQVCCPGAQDEYGWIFGDLLRLANGTSVAIDLIPLVAAPDPPPVTDSVASESGRHTPQRAAPAPGIPGSGGFGASGDTNPLTGLALPGGRGGQRPIIVCINNDFAARPQMGIGQADVMYEYLMEGYGITRFSGVYYGEEVSQIGPIRSARLINSYMGSLYDAGLACSGASDQVRYILKNQVPFPYLDVDLDDPSNTRYTTNVGSDYRTRLRTDTAKLRRWLADWGAEKAASLRGFTFGSVPDGGQPAASIGVPYPGSSRASYRYDTARGQYLRFMGGSPHLDGNNGAQVGVENVVVQYVPHETTNIVEDSLGSLSIRLNLFGSGRAFLFRDGFAFEGVWRSESGGDMPRFVAADGRELPLKPGHTWISVVPQSYTISYQ